ncbi:MAG: hypothetical protein ABEH77_07865 [Halobacteriaceae archaeon]
MATKRRLLDALVGLHERDERPRSVARLAEEVDADPAAVREKLDALQSYELVKRAPEGGYLPTVTGRELLELDIDDDEFVVVEVPDEEPMESA